jgi:hypothetical protein
MEKTKSIILGSFILYIIDNLMDPKDKTKGTVIQLRQKLAAKTISPDHKKAAELSNRVWADTINAFKDNKYRLHIGDSIEYLIYEDNSFVKVFGQDILDLAFKVAIKITESNIDKEVIKESREICSVLIDLTRKYSFEYCKGK